MNIKLNLVTRIDYKRSKWKVNLLRSLVLLCIIAATGHIATDINGLNYAFIGFLVTCLIFELIFRGQDFDYSNKLEKPDNNLILSPDFIGISTDKIKLKFILSEIRYIKVHYFGYQGETRSFSSIASHHDGYNNMLRIVTARKIMTFEFFLANIYQKRLLIRCLRDMESKGLKIHFYNNYDKQDINKKE